LKNCGDLFDWLFAEMSDLPEDKKKKKIYLPTQSHIKLNQINAKGGLPEEQTLINASRPYHITIV